MALSLRLRKRKSYPYSKINQWWNEFLRVFKIRNLTDQRFGRLVATKRICDESWLCHTFMWLFKKELNSVDIKGQRYGRLVAIMSLTEAVNLILFAFENGYSDIMYRKLRPVLSACLRKRLKEDKIIKVSVKGS